MGSGRDKRKKNKPKTGGESGAQKTERKTEKAEAKRERRVEKKAAADGDDIDAILAQLALEERAKTKVTVQQDCGPPSPRCNASLTALSDRELVLYGGELFDKAADRTYVYGELYRFRADKRVWSRIESPNSPPPRSGHAAAVWRNSLYVFGGEFTSPKQERFHHYKDLWRLDLASNEWTQLPLKGGPSARSGHRVVVWKNTLVLFGGFYDTGREVRYYGDMWALDLEELRWEPKGSPGALAPSPRSACQLVLHGNDVLLYGGYHKLVDEDGEDKATVHADAWALELPAFTWSKVKKQGFSPGPRAGFGLVAHKKRAVYFGGVVDREAKGGDVLVSEFYNELFTFQLESRRWFPLALKPLQKKGKKQEQEGEAATEAGGAAPDEPLRFVRAQTKEALAAIKIQSNFRGYVVRKAYKVYKLGGAVSELLYSPATARAAKDAPKPIGRINPGLVVLGDNLWLLGGVLEVGDEEVTLDDIWTLHLGKLDAWVCVKPLEVNLPRLEDGAASSSEEDASDEDD